MCSLIIKTFLLVLLRNFDSNMGVLLGFLTNSHWKSNLFLVFRVHEILLLRLWLLLKILQILLYLILIIADKPSFIALNQLSEVPLCLWLVLKFRQLRKIVKKTAWVFLNRVLIQRLMRKERGLGILLNHLHVWISGI